MSSFSTSNNHMCTPAVMSVSARSWNSQDFDRVVLCHLIESSNSCQHCKKELLRTVPKGQNKSKVSLHTDDRAGSDAKYLVSADDAPAPVPFKIAVEQQKQADEEWNDRLGNWWISNIMDTHRDSNPICRGHWLICAISILEGEFTIANLCEGRDIKDFLCLTLARYLDVHHEPLCWCSILPQSASIQKQKLRQLISEEMMIVDATMSCLAPEIRAVLIDIAGSRPDEVNTFTSFLDLWNSVECQRGLKLLHANETVRLQNLKIEWDRRRDAVDIINTARKNGLVTHIPKRFRLALFEKTDTMVWLLETMREVNPSHKIGRGYFPVKELLDQCRDEDDDVDSPEESCASLELQKALKLWSPLRDD